MKCVIMLALFALAAAQHHHGDPLEQLIHDEVLEILQNNHGISVDDCATKCDALFDLAGGHDEEMTDKICHMECEHVIQEHHHGHLPQNQN